MRSEVKTGFCGNSKEGGKIRKGKNDILKIEHGLLQCEKSPSTKPSIKSVSAHLKRSNVATCALRDHFMGPRNTCVKSFPLV